MKSSARPASGKPAGSKISTKDKITIGLILFFTAVALTLVLYWLIHHQEMETRKDLFAWLNSLYWPADRTYRIPGYPVEKAFTLSLEGVNTFLTPILSALLIRAILTHARYRYPLQLMIATYTAYGTLLYYSVAHISGYAVMTQQNIGNYLLFYLTNLPWFLGYAWMAWDAYRALIRDAG
jgi:hypothetical protein